MTYIWVALWPAPFAACLVLSGRPNADQNNELVQPRLEWRTDDDDGSGVWGPAYYHRLDLLGGR